MAGKFRKIATEEAWSIPEVAQELQKICSHLPAYSADLGLMAGVYDRQPGYGAMNFLDGLIDDERRIQEMDNHGIDCAVTALTAPGVQMFDADTAAELATLANDRLAALIAKHPGRFVGLATVPPHSPKRAARELERAIGQLKFNGVMINSHTNNEYLDSPKFWPILEAAEASGYPLYIHPRAASDLMSGPLRDYGMDAAMWGYGVEVGTHAVRIMASGVLDRFPKLKIVIGHMGEAVHFWLWRITFMNSRAQRIGRAPKTELTMDEYFRRNFAITTSGVEDPLALEYSIKKIGVDNVMWAIDYPYQPTQPAVEFMNKVDLPDADMAKVYGGNAERIFHIPAG